MTVKLPKPNPKTMPFPQSERENESAPEKTEAETKSLMLETGSGDVRKRRKQKTHIVYFIRVLYPFFLQVAYTNKPSLLQWFAPLSHLRVHFVEHKSSDY